ncbi:BapA prefix-like domain-containing protein [Rhizobium sp. SA279]|uniref:Ig-like domain-containing protein n=1 Tax=Agrobacterium deltaense TaxID=1183412 RepID=UPI003D987898
MASSSVLANHINVSVSLKNQTVTAPNEPTNFLVSADQQNVSNYARSGNNLVIQFNDGKIIRISDFFTHGLDFNNLVFVHDGGKWLTEFDKALGGGDGVMDPRVTYELISDSAAVLALLGILGAAAGGVISAANDGNGDDDNTRKDTTAPSAPTFVAIDDKAPGIGPIEHNSKTNDATPTLLGSAEPGSTVRIYDNGKLIGTTTAGADGKWSFTPSTPLADGAHTFSATATDKDNNTSSSSNPIVVEIDTIAPDQPAAPTGYVDNEGPVRSDDSTVPVTDDTTPGLNIGKLPDGTTPSLYMDGLKVDAVYDATKGTLTPKDPLKEGAHDLSYTVTDKAGNESKPSAPLKTEIDITAPNAPAITSAMDDVDPVKGPIVNGGFTNDTTPTLSGTGEPGATVTILDGKTPVGTAIVKKDGTWSVTTSPLGEGDHRLTATVTDEAGQTSTPSAPLTFTIDTQKPVTPSTPLSYADDVGSIRADESTASVTDDTRPGLNIGKVGDGTTPSLYVDGVKVAADYDAAKGTLTPKDPLGDGSHALSYTLTDKAGNESDRSGALKTEVDTKAPAAPVIDAVTDDAEPVTGAVLNGGVTNDTRPSLSGSGAEPNGVVKVYDKGVLVGETVADASGKWSFTPDAGKALSGGEHSLTASAVDAAGNEGPQGGAFTLTVATDGPSQTASVNAVLDDVDPVTGAVVSGGVTNDTAPSLSGTVSAALSAGDVVEVLRNGVVIGTATVAGTDWAYEDKGLSDGQTYSYTARVTNAAGVPGLEGAAHAITIDTVAPQDVSVRIASITDDTGVSGSDYITADNTLTVNGTLNREFAADEKLQLRLDSGDWIDVATTGKNWSYTDPANRILSDGQHVYDVRVVDRAGNIGSQTQQSVTIDTSKPTASLSITGYDDNEGRIQGIRQSGTYTDDTTPTLMGTVTGTLQPQEKVGIYLGAQLVGFADVSASNWSFTVPSALQDGKTYVFHAAVVSMAGGVGSTSNDLQLSIDTSDTNMAPKIGTSAAQSFSTGITLGKNGLWTVVSDQAIYSSNGIRDYSEQQLDISSTVAISNGKTVASQTKSGVWGGVPFGAWTFADYDRDGYQDMFTTDSDYDDGSSTVFRGSSAGLTATVLDYWKVDNVVRDPDVHLGGIMSIDINGDGYADVIVGDSQGDSATFLLNKGAAATGPGVEAGQWYGYGYDTTADDVTAPSIRYVTIDHEVSGVDIDNNGTIDFVGHTVANRADAFVISNGSASGMSVLKNSGVGSLNGSNWSISQTFDDVYNYNGSRGVSGAGEDNTYLHTVSMTWADFNGDGYLDLFMGNGRLGNSVSSDSVVYYNNNGTLSATAQRIRDGVMGKTTLAVDWDGDGDMDIVELPESGFSGAQSKLHRNNGAAAGGEVTWNTEVLGSVGETTHGTGRIDLGGISDVSGGSAVDYDWDGDVDVLISTLGGTPTVTVNNPNTPAEGTALHLRILDAQGFNSFYGNTVKLYDASGNLVASQILNPQSGAGVNDSSGIVHFFGLDPSQTYSAVLVRNVNGASQDVGAPGIAGVENVNAAWGHLTPGAANSAYVLTAEAGTNDASAVHGIVGTGYNDTFFATAGSDKFEGSGGTASVGGVSGWSATGGLDIVDYKLAGDAALTIDLDKAGAQNTGFGTATFSNIEGIAGGVGADTFTDNAGDNLFEGRAGNDVFNLTNGGRDTLLYKLLTDDATGGSGSDQVNGFTLGLYEAVPNADRVDLRDLLSGYKSDADGAAHHVNGVATIDPGETIRDYLSVTQSGGNTVISVDRDGAGAAFSAAPILTLNNVTTDLETLLANHQIVV